MDNLIRKRIRALRVTRGWPLEGLAARANLSQPSLGRFENGQHRLALDQLVILDLEINQAADISATAIATLLVCANDGIARSPYGGVLRVRHR